MKSAPVATTSTACTPHIVAAAPSTERIESGRTLTSPTST